MSDSINRKQASNPLISVIVTTYNRERYLTETLQAILKQTFQDFEILVVDNYSNYKFDELIKSLNSPKIRYFQNANNGVISVNRNVGLKYAVGKYVAFCDDDDVWIENKLEKQLALIKERDQTNNLVLIHCNTILFGADMVNQTTKKKNIRGIDDFLFTNNITYSTVLVSNSPVLRFDENPIYRASEDYNLWIELLLNGYRFELIELPLVYYRVDATSVSRQNPQSYIHLRYLIIILTNVVKYKVDNICVVKLFLMMVCEYMKFVIRLKRKKINYTSLFF